MKISINHREVMRRRRLSVTMLPSLARLPRLLTLVLLVAHGRSEGGDARPKGGEVTVLSTHGGYRLRLEQIDQPKSPWDDHLFSLCMRFRLEFPQEGPVKFLPSLPENVFLENEDPLVAAVIPGGQNVASHKHFGWTSNHGPTVEINQLEVGKEQRLLDHLELRATLVKVTEYEELEFKDVHKGVNEDLHCGPFELSAQGEATRLALSAGAFSKFTGEHMAYAGRVPLKFVHHVYALDHVCIMDARGRRLEETVVTYTGGGSAGGFVIQGAHILSITANQTVAKPSAADEEIAYPVTIKMKLPKTWQKEQLTFRMDNIELPPSKAR